jgi:c-di-GMP-binding flagellar brake protein YcgR
MEENRKYIRIDWPVIIKYKTVEEPKAQDQVVSKDVSEGGARFIVYERLARGTKLDIQLEAPFDSLPISITAEVAWIKRIGPEESKAFEIGVSFKSVNTNDQKRFKSYLENEIKDRK